MYTRALKLPEMSFFLLGPRATGKTTWLKRSLNDPPVHWVNLLLDSELARIANNPAVFQQEVSALPADTWVVVDEVQRLPSLLNQVHHILTEHPGRYRFALTGSSARKLRRKSTNMLAGRALSLQFFPLTRSEMAKDFDLESALQFGTLPLVVSAPNDMLRRQILKAYGETYLTQEIRAEAAVKSLESFSRFLQVAALMNGQAINTSNVARDASVSRTTVQGYFEILQDTLIGYFLPAFRPRKRVRESAHPKFYLFDTGVARTLNGTLFNQLTDMERGPLFETWVCHELRAYLEYSQCGGELAYWRTPNGVEVDFILSRGDSAIGIEVKSSATWRAHSGDALKELLRENVIQRAIGVYGGEHMIKDGPIEVYPAATWAAKLAEGAFVC